jgi:hypothetical protein
MGRAGFISGPKARMRNYYKHKKLGLCVNCSRKAVKGKTHCKKHLEAERRYRDKRRRMYDKGK